MKHKNSMTIVASTTELVAKLMENLLGHRAQVEKARKGFELEAQELLEAGLARLRSGKLDNLQLYLAGVQDHSESYELAIAMLRMHAGETIEIEADDFNNYVMDRWSWKQEWLVSNSKYLG